MLIMTDNEMTNQNVERILREGGLMDNCKVENAVIVSVSWGDWKHNHDKLISLMCQNGYIHKQEIVTEDNGSDCYTADHVFVKGEKA